MKRFIALQKIVKLGSFSKAAEDLGYTQSALSQMISSLESEFSVKLLNRFRTGTKLTLEGEKIYPLIEKTVNQYFMVIEKVKEIRDPETGIVRMGTLASISAHWIPGLLKGFQSLYPAVEFVIHQGDYISIQEWIRTGAIDFGFVNPKAVSGLEIIELKKGEMLAIVPENHYLAKKKLFHLTPWRKNLLFCWKKGIITNLWKPLNRLGKIRI